MVVGLSTDYRLFGGSSWVVVPSVVAGVGASNSRVAEVLFQTLCVFLLVFCLPAAVSVRPC